MADWVQHLVQLAIWGAVLAAFAAVAVCVIRKVRSDKEEEDLSASELMSKFRELHSRGVLSDAEFRTIKTSLVTRLREELKDTAETGCDGGGNRAGGGGA
jgi:hypothetical protein